MIQDNFQYYLLGLFPKDNSAISYSSIKELSANQIKSDKEIKEAIIQLTAEKYIKTNLKGFAITEEGLSALENYKEPAPELSNIETTEIESKEIDSIKEKMHTGVDFTSNGNKLIAKIILLKRHRSIERIAALVVVAGAFAFGYYFGGMNPSEEKNRIQQENQQLKQKSESLIQQIFVDSLRLDSLR